MKDLGLAGEYADTGTSGTKENALRRQAGRDSRADVRHQAGFVQPEPADFRAAVSVQITASKFQKRQRWGPRRGTQQERSLATVYPSLALPCLLNPQVVVLLQGKLADVSVSFKEVLEVRTKNIQASRSRTENFVSSVSASSHGLQNDPYASSSPLYSNTPTKSPTPSPGYANSDVLNLDPGSAMSLPGSGKTAGQNPEQQALLMEEAQPVNTYINARGEAIETIERTINELGSVFSQLATMVSEQGDQITRIDQDTDDVVQNVEGAQRELYVSFPLVFGVVPCGPRHQAC